jgi:hypothetical protein
MLFRRARLTVRLDIFNDNSYDNFGEGKHRALASYLEQMLLMQSR